MFGSMYLDQRWSRVERAGRVEMSERAKNAFVAYRVAFVALVDAELALDTCHCPSVEWMAEFKRLRESGQFEEARDFEDDWLRGNHERRRVALEVKFAAMAVLTRARARFDAESKDHPHDWRWYVSARDGDNTAIVLGPFASPEAAADAVPTGTRLALEHFADAAFAAFGICAGDPRALGEGRLNCFA